MFVLYKHFMNIVLHSSRFDCLFLRFCPTFNISPVLRNQSVMVTDGLTNTHIFPNKSISHNLVNNKCFLCKPSYFGLFLKNNKQEQNVFARNKLKLHGIICNGSWKVQYFTRLILISVYTSMYMIHSDFESPKNLW